MGIDIQTYRCRIGSFVPDRGNAVGSRSFLVNCGEMVRLTGAMAFIGMLLLMAGVESNPGPKGTKDGFSFRYQYLLIEVGTVILRKLFDHQVSSNFKQYLDNHPADKSQLKFLIRRGKITAEQQRLIPPVDNNPSSSKFDITLLCCLLRNACGLKVYTDTAWIHPLPTDTSVEANVTRLRECRNQLMHSGSVFDSKTNLEAKWMELCKILTELGKICKIKDLPSRIDEANNVSIDEQLETKFNKMMSEWAEMDRWFDRRIGEVVSMVNQCAVGIGHIVTGQQKTNTRLENVEQTLNLSNNEVMTDIQQTLRDVYMASCSRLALSPLFKDEHKELLKIYRIPSLFLVDYHEAKIDQTTTEVTSCRDIFFKDQQPCRNIYITGDAGVGKSSFCMYLSLLWSMSKLGNTINNDRMQKDAAFFAKFDYLFYVTLRDTDRTDVIAMIVDQLFNTECDDRWNKMYKSIDNILKYGDSLVILDGLDEWQPERRGKRDNEIPCRPIWKKCMYVTTCRPYKIENVRLLQEDLDQQVTMTGIHGSSMEFYVTEIINHVNEKYRENNDPYDFFRKVKECGLQELLCIPIITSHLIMIWLDQSLTAMSRSLIYGTVVDMLFKIATCKDRTVEFPSLTSPTLQIPDSLSKLQYFTEHFSLLEKVCLLSFRSLFKQDKCETNLVFTNQQLMAEPYFLSDSEVNVLCKIGILSKNKVARRFGTLEHRLSFLHLSYLEFFAAVYVSSFETGQLSDTFNKLTTIDEVLYLENFFLFLAGFSCNKLEYIFEQLYVSLSDELTLCRRNAIFHYNSIVYMEQIYALQNTVVNCFKEGRKVSNGNVYLKLEDFVFDDSSYVDDLKILLSLNTACVKSIHSVKGKYYDEFDQITNLQCLNIGKVLSGDDVKFTEYMLKNQSTLYTICIKSNCPLIQEIQELQVRGLQHLTSLSLQFAEMHYNSLRGLVQFLSDGVLIENIKLTDVSCDKQLNRRSDWSLTLDLSRHTKLISLYLKDVDIVCNNVNNSSLKYITLIPFSARSVSGYIGVVDCIQNSQLEHLYINGSHLLELNVNTVKTLPNIKSLTLLNMTLHKDIVLQLHPSVTQVTIELWKVTVSRQCFEYFIKSFQNNESVIKVKLLGCTITLVDEETHRELSMVESMDYMFSYLTSIPTVHITDKGGILDNLLHFETRSCH